MQKFCPHCGAEYTSWQNQPQYCGNCGKPLGSTDQTQEEKDHARGGCLIIVLILVGALIYFGYYYFKNSVIHGQVYVITQDEETVKMPNIRVRFVKREVLEQVMGKISDALATEFPDYKSNYDGARTDNARQDIRLAWENEIEEQTANAFRQEYLNARINSYTGHIHLKDWVFDGVTDSDGNFTVNVPHGDFIVMAFGQRQVLDKTEEYFWDGTQHTDHWKDYHIQINNALNRIVHLEEFSDTANMAFVGDMEQNCGLSVPELPTK